jgi:hypothetical protein
MTLTYNTGANTKLQREINQTTRVTQIYTELKLDANNITKIFLLSYTFIIQNYNKALPAKIVNTNYIIKYNPW